MDDRVRRSQEEDGWFYPQKRLGPVARWRWKRKYRRELKDIDRAIEEYKKELG